MQYAILDGGRSQPVKSEKQALCPMCKSPVIAKMGDIMLHHWAHVTLCGCDPHRENETVWHRRWKNSFPVKCREVVLGNHRADVLTLDRNVLEFQHSSIDYAKIADRHKAYGWRLTWVIDAESLARDVEYTLRDDGTYKVWWKRFSGVWANQKIALHYQTQGAIFELIWPPRRFDKNNRWYSRAKLMDVGDFVAKHRGNADKGWPDRTPLTTRSLNVKTGEQRMMDKQAKWAETEEYLSRVQDRDYGHNW